MSLICNTRCLNATLTGTQRYTQKILEAFPEQVERIAPTQDISRGIKGHVWEQFILPGKLKNNLLWSPSNSGPMFYKKQVVTIHDLVSVDHPEWFNKKFVKWYNYMLPRLCKNAEHIIAISDFTRQRIMDIYNIPDSKITMIHNGADVDRAMSSQMMELPFKNYVLSLGSLEPRKNIPLLLSAWGNILTKIPNDTGLVIVGGAGNSKIFKDAGINKLPERVFFTGHVNDGYLYQLYKNAICFVYLSTYEGFGLPPLEAMSIGIPVLTGNRTALPEVVGDGGLLIDPASLAECENGLFRLITDRGLREDIASKAKVQTRKFSWKNTASKTWEVLEHFM